MIDFTYCEVKSAIKSHFSDNEVLSVNPIVKSINEPFANDDNTVYYGALANGVGATVAYRNYALSPNYPDLLFNFVNGSYDGFSGYEIKLKNKLRPIDEIPLYIFFNTDALNGWPIDIKWGDIAINNGDSHPYGIMKKGFKLISYTDEVKMSLDVGSAGLAVLTVTESSFQWDGELGGYAVLIYLGGVS